VPSYIEVPVGCTLCFCAQNRVQARFLSTPFSIQTVRFIGSPSTSNACEQAARAFAAAPDDGARWARLRSVAGRGDLCRRLAGFERRAGEEPVRYADVEAAAHLQLHCGHAPAAAASFARAAELRPGTAAPLVGRAAALKATGDRAGAIAALEAALPVADKPASVVRWYAKRPLLVATATSTTCASRNPATKIFPPPAPSIARLTAPARGRQVRGVLDVSIHRREGLRPSSGMSSDLRGQAGQLSGQLHRAPQAGSSRMFVAAEARWRPMVAVTVTDTSVVPPEVVMLASAKRLLPPEALVIFTRVWSARLNESTRSARAFASSRVIPFVPC
jgi:hypothetical protein